MSDNPISCNRRAFERDENCDRGTVDVNQFDDLPFCDPINPSEPDIPPEIVDTPLNLPIPPACSCINISYKLETHYGPNLTSTAGFKAIGDCCSGNYESSINLAVPCPVPSKFNQKSFAVKNVRDAKRVGVDLLSKTGECSFRVNDGDVDLQVECPIPDKINSITLSKGWVDTTDKSGEEQTWEILTNGDECTFNVSNTLDLKIPCPLPYKLNPVKVTKEWKNPDEFKNDQEIKYLENDNCKITLQDINLTIPCPLPYKLNPVKVTKEWKNPDEFKNDQEIKYLENDNCKITLQDINLTIPCPLPQGEQNIIIRPEWVKKEKHSESSDSDLPLTRKDEDFSQTIGTGSVCSFSFTNKISLEVECPIQGKINVIRQVEKKAGFEFRINDNSKQSNSNCDLTNIDFIYPLCAIKTNSGLDSDLYEYDEEKEKCVGFGEQLLIPCQVRLDKIDVRSAKKEEISEPFAFVKKDEEKTDCDIENYEFIYEKCIFKIQNTCVNLGQNINIEGGNCTNLKATYNGSKLTLSLYWS